MIRCAPSTGAAYAGDVNVIHPGDDGYRRARSARRGEACLDPRLDGFVARFEQRFRFRPLWLETDLVTRTDAPHPWLRADVVLERTEQYRTFCRSTLGYDRRKQRLVARLLVEELGAEGLCQLFALPQAPRAGSPSGSDVFVCFSDFEAVATSEAHGGVTPDESARFASSLGLGDDLWCLQRLWGPPIVFVHTDRQAAGLRSSAAPARWADDYYDVVRRHDEFGYLTRAGIVIAVDSKETLDRDYGGNWYYYFK